jgi:hypothetical protein
VSDLHRAPQLAAPTLLVIGEVVRLADPSNIGEAFIQPGAWSENGSFPVTLFENIPLADSVPGDEERTA